ncbi:hypothetical protein FMN50_13970 [Rhodobacterales bacterium]|nr:hypothetical protein FMN50_13970 [Rhodobacterales bacterium]
MNKQIRALKNRHLNEAPFSENKAHQIRRGEEKVISKLRTAPEHIDLKPDCGRCVSLCCVVFAFDRSESFAVDKAAGEPCPNLAASGTCRIFENRARLGFRGCITYDCHGAGQRVTQDIFQGRSWRDDPALSSRMGSALSVLRRIHGQLTLLQSAEKLPLDSPEREALSDFRQTLCPQSDWTEESLASFKIDAAERDIAQFLRSLRRHIP